MSKSRMNFVNVSIQSAASYLYIPSLILSLLKSFVPLSSRMLVLELRAIVTVITLYKKSSEALGDDFLAPKVALYGLQFYFQTEN